MPLQTNGVTFLTSKDTCHLLHIACSTYTNRRTSHGDRFLKAHHDIIRGRALFRLEAVARLVSERAA